MATGIRDKVAIIGMGCTRFGERWDVGAEELMVEAFEECLEDAGIDRNEIEAAWLGTCIEEINVGKSGLPLSTTLRLPFIPVTRTENFCASGTEAFRGAVYAVASGAYDICLAMGVEKLKDTGYGGLPNPGSGFGSLSWLWWPNVTAPGAFAQLATAYAAKYRVPDEDTQARHGPGLGEEPRQRRPQSQGPPAKDRHRRTGHGRPHHRPSSRPLRLLRGERRGGLRHRHHGGKGQGHGQKGFRHGQGASAGPQQRRGDGLTTTGTASHFMTTDKCSPRPTRRRASKTRGKRSA